MRQFHTWHLLLVIALLLPGLVSAGARISVSPIAADSDFQCFSPLADAYVNNQEPDTNFGDETNLALSSFGDVVVQRHYSYLRFNLDAVPDGATVLNAELELYLASAAGSFSASLQAVDQNWGEASITWNNKPGTSGNFDNPVHDDTPGVKVWQAEQLVGDWVSGQRANRGLALVTAGVGTPLAEFFSRETTNGLEPQLCVQWTENPTDVDLVIDAIEVTQSVQDLHNSVRLVADKRTFVRVHVRSLSSRRFRTYATLTLVRPGAGPITLYPINPGTGHLMAEQDPDRSQPDDTFLFELPSSATASGLLALSAELNPVLDWRGRYPPETNYGNNSMSTTVTFEAVPRLGLVIYAGGYHVGGTAYETPISHLHQTRDWLLRAFPVSDIWMTTRTYDFGEVQVKNGDFDKPNAGKINRWLKRKRRHDLVEGAWYGAHVGDVRDVRYYAMMTTDGAFMRGKAPIGGRVASGPTWALASGGWDPDGIYGDWYAGHELGHSLRRKHVRGDPSGAPGGCGGERGIDRGYPYDDGFISDASNGADAFFGFDVGSETGAYGILLQAIRIYDPGWRDLMTYCAPQWISDYTYEGVMDYLEDNVTPLALTQGTDRLQQTDRLLVVGTIDLPGQQTSLEPLLLLHDVPEVEPRIPGDYSIVLLDGDNNVLADYPFTPEEMDAGPPDPEGGSEVSFPQPLIGELVPYVDGTVRVDIKGPSGVLTTVVAGPATPAVTLVAPNGGGTLSGDSIPVSWSASDADGDDLLFDVAFSPDDGATWELLAQGVSSNTVAISRENIPTTSQGRFRVYASDGIHTGSDDSDAPFATALRSPEVTILSPASGTAFAANQTISFQALAFSPNIGTLPEDNVTWVSSIDGVIGKGERLSLTGLTPGVHTVGVFVTDGAGSDADSIQNVLIVENPGLLPPLPHGLLAAPDPLLFWPGSGIISRQLTIDNQSGTDSIPWAAFPVDPWVHLSATSGSTPAQITVSVDDETLPPGVQQSGIILGSSDVPGQLVRVDIAVNVHEEGYFIHLPAVRRE